MTEADELEVLRDEVSELRKQVERLNSYLGLSRPVATPAGPFYHQGPVQPLPMPPIYQPNTADASGIYHRPQTAAAAVDWSRILGDPMKSFGTRVGDPDVSSRRLVGDGGTVV